MRKYDRDSPEFARQTAVMDALPHAIHPMHGNWRTGADALIDELRVRGYEIVPAPVVITSPGVAKISCSCKCHVGEYPHTSNFCHCGGTR